MDPKENPYASTTYAYEGFKGRPKTKPVSITVFGILNLVFGVPGLLFAPLNLLFAYFIESGQGPPNPVWDLMRNSPSYMLFYKTSIWVWIIFSVVIIAAGVGLLMGRAWGRSLALIYGGFSIFWAIVGFVGNYFLLLQPLSQLDGPEATGGYIGGLVGGIIGLLGGLIYPVLLLIFMNRSIVVEYFRHQPTGDRYD